MFACVRFNQTCIYFKIHQQKLKAGTRIPATDLQFHCCGSAQGLASLCQKYMLKFTIASERGCRRNFKPVMKEKLKQLQVVFWTSKNTEKYLNVYKCSPDDATIAHIYLLFIFIILAALGSTFVLMLPRLAVGGITNVKHCSSHDSSPIHCLHLQLSACPSITRCSNYSLCSHTTCAGLQRQLHYTAESAAQHVKHKRYRNIEGNMPVSREEACDL